MENPFEIINQRLDRIEQLLHQVNSHFMNNNSKNKYPDLLDLNQVTEYLSLSKSHIYKLTNKNGIPFSKQGKKLYFDKEVITLWALENKNAVQEEIQQKANEYLLKKGLKKRKNN